MSEALLKDFIERVIENRDPEIMREFYEHMFVLRNHRDYAKCQAVEKAEWESIKEAAEALMADDKMRYGHGG